MSEPVLGGRSFSIPLVRASDDTREGFVPSPHISDSARENALYCATRSSYVTNPNALVAIREGKLGRLALDLLAALDQLAEREKEIDRLKGELARVASFESRYGPSDEASIAREALDGVW